MACRFIFKLLTSIVILSSLIGTCFIQVNPFCAGLEFKHKDFIHSYIHQPHTYMTTAYQIIDKYLRENLKTDHLDKNLDVIVTLRREQEEDYIESLSPKSKRIFDFKKPKKPFLLSTVLESIGISNSTGIMLDALKLLSRLEYILIAKNKVHVCTVQVAHDLAVNNYIAVDPIGRRIRAKDGLVQINLMPRIETLIYKAALKKASICLPYYPILVTKEFFLSNGYFTMIADFWNQVIYHRMERDHLCDNDTLPDDVFAWNPTFAYNYVLDIENLIEPIELSKLKMLYDEHGWGEPDGQLMDLVDLAYKFFWTKFRQFVDAMKPIFEAYDFDKHLAPYIPGKRYQPSEFTYQVDQIKAYLYLSQRFLIEKNTFYKAFDKYMDLVMEVKAREKAEVEARNKQIAEGSSKHRVEEGTSNNEIRRTR